MELTQTTIEIIVYLAVITWAGLLVGWIFVKLDKRDDEKRKAKQDMEALLKRSDETIQQVREIRQMLRDMK